MSSTSRSSRSSDQSRFVRIVAWAVALMSYPFHWFAYKFRMRRGATDVGISEMSMNDPQWGKRPNGGGNKNEGPPDLDEMLKKLNQKLGGLFGNKGNNTGGGGNGGPSKAMMGGGLMLGIGLVIAVWLATGFYTVEQGRIGVELRLGKFTQTTKAGLHWRIPYPIETVEVVKAEEVKAIEVGHRNNQKQKMPDEALMLTEDQNIVDVQFAVQYTISSPEDYLFSNTKPDDTVRQVAETAMREIVGKSKMDFVLYEGRTDIGVRSKKLMQVILDRYKTGINISTVTMQNAQPPAEVQASFDDVVRAKQFREQLKNEGEAYANEIVPRAKGTAARLMEEAEGHKQRVVANAQGDVSRFTQVLTEYERAPGVTRERMYLDVMQRIMQNTSKVVVDQKGGQNLLYLPLDKLIEASGGSSASSAAVSDATPRPGTATTNTIPAITPEASRARDLRARETR
jgi:modulator of FtsH protease HflK